MVSPYWERHEDFRAAIQAAREAIDAASRAEEAYYASASFPHDSKAYVMAAREETARRQADRIHDEVTEAMGHLRDALGAWWPATSVSFMVTRD